MVDFRAVHVPLWRGFRGEVKADFFVNIKFDNFLEWLFSRSLPRAGYSLFPGWKSKQKITAASDAMKGSELARVVTAAPAKAEDRLGRVCERTICGWFEFDFFYPIFKI